MKPITLTLSPEQAHNAIVLWDIALKHPDGGIKIMREVVLLVDIVNLAVAEAQKPDAPPDS